MVTASRLPAWSHTYVSFWPLALSVRLVRLSHVVRERTAEAASKIVPDGSATYCTPAARFHRPGITNDLKKGGTLAKAQKMAGHADPRTTKLYDRTVQTVRLEEVERISI